jgi:very-short-patch-repair endonuclease
MRVVPRERSMERKTDVARKKMRSKAVARARTLRATQTDAERLLWRHLRNRGLYGWKFRRQRPIGQYVADFVCMEAKLIVEVDGSQHMENRDDVKRTAGLESQGFRVMRFWNNEVLEQTEAVLSAIGEELQHESEAMTG